MWGLDSFASLWSKQDADGIGGIWIGIVIAVIILNLIACWRVYTKTNRPGWASLIPIYNIYVLLQIIGRPVWWLLLYVVPVVNIIIHIVVAIDTAKAFRKSAAFGFFGLFLLPPIGFMILGFGKAKYNKSKLGNKKTSESASKHLGIILLTLLLAVGLVLGVWYGWQYKQERRIKTAQQTISSKFKNIHLETDNYQNEFLQAHATYLITENDTINKDVRGLVDTYFKPCKTAGERNHSSGVTYECLASPEINFATDAYLEVTYKFRTYPDQTAGNGADEVYVGLLYDRKTGKRLGIADLFKPDAAFAQALSDESREALNNTYNTAYYSKGQFKDAMMQATNPDPANFKDFLLTTDEKLTFIFEPGEVAPKEEGIVQIDVNTDKLYDLFNSTTIDVFLPKLKEQKEAEKRLAEAAAESRKRAREMVGTNRENIDCAKMKCIALTYDDGPYAPYGNRLLDILKERNAVTTFFMVGNRVAAYEAELKRVINEKSEIGNHSWDHSDLTTLSDAEVASQVERTNQAIYGASGVYPKLIRPPYGAVNARVNAQINMPQVFWSVDTLDWKFRNADTVYQNAIAGAKPGAIILMHEIHETTIDAAARIVDELQRQGYTLVTVSELFGINKDNLAEFNNRKLFHN